MTITELKETFIQMGLHAKINDLDEVIRVYENETAARVDDWFIEIPFDALLFFHVDTVVRHVLMDYLNEEDCEEAIARIKRDIKK